MKTFGWRAWAYFVATLLVGLSFSSLTWGEAGYQTGTLLGVEKKVEITPRSYLWDTVVTYTETVTYQLRIQIGATIYTTDYTPDIQPSPLPAGWQIDRPLPGRIEKHRMFLKTSYGEVVSFIRKRG